MSNKCEHGAYLDIQRCVYCDEARIAELEAENAKLENEIVMKTLENCRLQRELREPLEVGDEAKS
jgi:hypothetical protein